MLVLAAGSAGAGYLLMREEAADPLAAGEPVLVTAGELAAVAAEREAPIYWAGPPESGSLELSTTSEGTYVRYLAPEADAGADRLALTVATYPLDDAYATAVERGRSPRMSTRRLGADGIAVSQESGATSVYLAFRGVPYLVEVYDPDGAAARRLAFSGEIEPVR